MPVGPWGLRYISGLRFGEGLRRTPPTDDASLSGHLQWAAEAGWQLVILGDLSRELAQLPFEMLLFCWWHVLVLGPAERAWEENAAQMGRQSSVGIIIGTAEDWPRNCIVMEDNYLGRPVRVLASYAPQRDLKGCEWNVFGQWDPMWVGDPAWDWVIRDSRYLPAEVRETGGQSLTLFELIKARHDRRAQ